MDLLGNLLMLSWTVLLCGHKLHNEPAALLKVGLKKHYRVSTAHIVKSTL